MKRNKSSHIVMDYEGRGTLSSTAVLDTFYEYERLATNRYPVRHIWRAGYLAALRDNQLINRIQWDKLNTASRNREGAEG